MHVIKNVLAIFSKPCDSPHKKKMSHFEHIIQLSSAIVFNNVANNMNICSCDHKICL